MATRELIQVDVDGGVATAALNDADRRNALGMEMFDALDETLTRIAGLDHVAVLLLRGHGKVFCAGFDLAAAVEDHDLLAAFIDRLGALLRRLRRLPQVVIGVVHGAAIAGGCAIVSACDLAVVSAGARLGYPVVRLGISPAVSTATLQQAIGAGAARALFLGGELIDGRTAFRIGLASHLSADDASVLADANALGRTIAGHGPHALRTTKAWLNQLDGSLDDERFTAPAADTGRRATGPESVAMLEAFWRSRGDAGRRQP